MALVLGACGGGSDATPTVADSAEATAEATATAVAPAVSPTADALTAREPDGQRAFEHVRMLAEQIGPRVAGTSGEIAARDYIRDTLASYGYDVTLQPFDFDASSFRPSRVDGGGVVIPAYSVQGSPGGEVTGKLVDAGIGRPEEFPSGSSGFVALIKRGDLTFRQKVDNAAAAGAAAVIIYNTDPVRLIANANGPITVPSLGVPSTDGDVLRGQAAAGGSATVTVPAPSGTAYNVIAKPRGVTQCATVTGGHYDSVPAAPGADDNASGTAATIEVARVMAANSTEGENCFVLFSGEEFGLFGSKAFVRGLSDADVNAMRVMVNLDMVGVDGPLMLIGSSDVVEEARIIADAADIDAAPGNVPAGSSSDHASFASAGIPVVFFNERDDKLLHTPQDNLSRIRADSLADAVQLALGTLKAMNGE
jgi:aminopeptidase YwaD